MPLFLLHACCFKAKTFIGSRGPLNSKLGPARTWEFAGVILYKGYKGKGVYRDNGEIDNGYRRLM